MAASTKPVYLDYNATTPIAPEVWEEMQRYYHHFGNASSGHVFGREPREAIVRARSRVASLIGCSPSEILFTSGGTESNNYILKGVVRAVQLQRKQQPDECHRPIHIVSSAIEHPAILQTLAFLKEADEVLVTLVGVDHNGCVDLQELERSITNDTVLVTIMHANNEVGTLQPLKEIAAICRRRSPSVLFHTDASQSLGKTRVDELGVDFLTIAGHKLYAPKGVGAVYIRSDTLQQRAITIPPLLHGASQENGLRGGTENVMMIAALGKACELLEQSLEQAKFDEHSQQLRDRLYTKLTERLTGLTRNGHPTEALPNTLSISITGVTSKQVLDAISDRVACSAGAACHSGHVSVSGTLAAMGLTPEAALSTLRLSTGRFSTEEEIDLAVHVLVSTIEQLRA